MIDLSAAHLTLVRQILSRRVPNAKAIAFGSRVTGHSVDYSDLDLALEADEKLDLSLLEYLKVDFEESSLPFRVDILDFNAISAEFKKIIKSNCETIAPLNS